MLVGERRNRSVLVGIVGDEERIDEHGLDLAVSEMHLKWRRSESQTLVSCLSACHDLVNG